MKKSGKITKTKQVCMTLLGIASAILLLIQQPLSQLVDANDQITAIENSNDLDQPVEETYQMVAYEVLVPIMSFNLFHSFDLLIELPSLEDPSSALIENSIAVFDSFLENLLRRIIAPNAP
ncbi:MAG: hypothetical protein ACJAT1_001858 [Marivirga sp.]|jgi:hypothetical protein